MRGEGRQMPIARVNGARLYLQTGGAGPAIVFAHGLLMSQAMFERQAAALEDRFRCLRFDFRGQGWSEVAAGGYDMDSLADDAIALIERLNTGPCHFVGLSMGGFVGMRIALRRPDLLRSLVLLDTSGDPEPAANLPRYRALNFVARWFGLHLVGDQDTATPLECSQRLHQAIPGSKLVVVPGAGHSSTIEQPGFVTEALESFLT